MKKNLKSFQIFSLPVGCQVIQGHHTAKKELLKLIKKKQKKKKRERKNKKKIKIKIKIKITNDIVKGLNHQPLSKTPPTIRLHYILSTLVFPFPPVILGRDGRLICKYYK